MINVDFTIDCYKRLLDGEQVFFQHGDSITVFIGYCLGKGIPVDELRIKINPPAGEGYWVKYQVDGGWKTVREVL